MRDVLRQQSQGTACGPGPEGRSGAVVIAEVAQSHDGSLGQAHAFIDAIAAAGADAVKFQTHIAAAESTPAEPWRVRFSRQDASRYDYWRRMEFTREQWIGLRDHARERGLWFISSAFSPEAIELLEQLEIPAWKVASGELASSPLLDRMLATKKPMILSSGMSPWSELDSVVARVRASGNALAMLQCTTAYPCPPERIGLNVIDEMRRRYAGCFVGLSDHSGNIFAGLAASALGIDVLELHVCFHRGMFGPDVSSSVTFEELAQLVRGMRAIETMRAHPVDKDRAAADVEPLRRLFTKSIVASRALDAGAVVTAGDIAIKKPGGGLGADAIEQVVGRRLKRALAADEQVRLEDLV